MSQTKDIKQVVLVTGGSAGLGQVICQQLSSAGYTVYGTGRSLTNGESIENYSQLQMDVTNDDSVTAGVNFLFEREGRIDILINNAGITHAAPIEETSFDQAHSVFETNFYGPLRLIQAVLPFMRKANKGRIINISSIAADISLPFRGIYSASKSALEGMSNALSLELKSFNIEVAIIQPGDFKTNIFHKREENQLKHDSPYLNKFNNHMTNIQNEMNQSLPPEILGTELLKILSAPRLQLKYPIGTISQKLSMQIRKILPGRVFEKILQQHFKI